MVGTTISHYKILEKIGQGGMGTVYRAQDTTLDRKVALKFLPEELEQDSTARNRFLREAKLAAALDHPYICHIHEVGEVEGKSFIAMEYVQGTTLGEKLTEGPLPVRKALETAGEIAEALEAAHKQEIVHRDLKPSNIMLTPEGHVKVMDFGLAKRVTPVEGQEQDITTALTRQGSMLGTVPYMSPEQVRGQEVDTRSDIFSFGVVLYEMLTGVNPFKGDTSVDTSHAIIGETPPPLTRYTENIPVLLQHTVKKMLAKDPDRRFQSVHEVRTDLAELVEEGGDPQSTRGETQEAMASATVIADRPGWQRAIPLVTALLGAVAVASVVLWNLLGPPEPPPLDPSRFVISLPAASRLAEADFGIQLALSPDGKQVAFVATSGEVESVYVRPIDAFEARPIPGTGGAQSPFFSPDSRWLGFFAEGKLKKVLLPDGYPVTLCDAEAGSASWGADDTIVFTLRQQTPRLFTVSANGGTPQEVSTLPPEATDMRYMSPDLLPGGKSILVTVASGGGFENTSIYVFSMDTGEGRILVERAFQARYALGYLIYARSDSLMAVPFDIDRLEVSGSPVPVLPGVRSNTLGTAQYSVSREGSLIYVSAQRAPALPIWVDRSGDIQSIDVQARGFWGPRLSPDGSRLAMSANDAVMETWILELDRGALTRFTFEGNNHIPIWTPDGMRLVFSSNREGGADNLFWKPADGSGEPERLSTTDYHQDPASFSPDGKLLAFAQSHPETKWDIWLLHMDNERRAEPFLRTEFDEYDPMISPNGQWLAYTSNESGQFEVYVQSIPDGGKKWVISTEGGWEPLWAQNGRELFYRDRDRLMAVAVETEDVFAAERPRLLFDASGIRGPAGYGAPNFDVTPDGQQFVMMRRSEASAQTQINVVLNWFEELQRLVPTP